MLKFTNRCVIWMIKHSCFIKPLARLLNFSMHLKWPARWTEVNNSLNFSMSRKFLTPCWESREKNGFRWVQNLWTENFFLKWFTPYLKVKSIIRPIRYASYNMVPLIWTISYGHYSISPISSYLVYFRERKSFVLTKANFYIKLCLRSDLLKNDLIIIWSALYLLMYLMLNKAQSFLCHELDITSTVRVMLACSCL